MNINSFISKRLSPNLITAYDLLQGLTFQAAMSEIIRVFKPAGRLMVADQFAARSVQKDIKARSANWFQ